MRIPFNNIINFVLLQCNKMNIDESHSLNHALDVLNVSKQIYNEEVADNPHILSQKHIIYTSALIHDTCDSKYCDEQKAKQDITTFLQENSYTEKDTEAIMNVITSMSYHKIKQYGFPNLGEYQCAFNVVREADLLTGYDLNRALLYGIHVQDHSFTGSFIESKQLYEMRMKLLIDDGHFITKYGIRMAPIKNEMMVKDMKNLEDMINIM